VFNLYIGKFVFPDPDYPEQAAQGHMVMGLSVLLLVIVRFIVRQRLPRPADAESGSKLTDMLARLVHYGLPHRADADHRRGRELCDAFRPPRQLPRRGWPPDAAGVRVHAARFHGLMRTSFAAAHPDARRGGAAIISSSADNLITLIAHVVSLRAILPPKQSCSFPRSTEERDCFGDERPRNDIPKGGETEHVVVEIRAIRIRDLLLDGGPR
jgi:hypothetical protein